MMRMRRIPSREGPQGQRLFPCEKKGTDTPWSHPGETVYTEQGPTGLRPLLLVILCKPKILNAAL